MNQLLKSRCLKWDRDIFLNLSVQDNGYSDDAEGEDGKDDDDIHNKDDEYGKVDGEDGVDDQEDDEDDEEDGKEDGEDDDYIVDDGEEDIDGWVRCQLAQSPYSLAGGNIYLLIIIVIINRGITRILL